MVVGKDLEVLVEELDTCQNIMKKGTNPHCVEVMKTKVETGQDGRIPRGGMVVRIGEIGVVGIVGTGTLPQAIHDSKEIAKVRELTDRRSSGLVVHMGGWMVSGNLVKDLEGINIIISMTGANKGVVAISGKDGTGEMTSGMILGEEIKGISTLDHIMVDHENVVNLYI